MLRDEHGRSVSYMRLSVTDRCNLRCFYCRSGGDIPFIPHDDILTYEEFLRLIDLAASFGVSKIRLTGGEPLLRRDFMGFLERAYRRAPGVDLRLTTNATLLPGKVRTLKELGVSCLNISLDTLNERKYAEITGGDFYRQVRQSIDECLEEGVRVKLNAVAVRGVNDDELPAFIQLARDNPIDVRFIEFMPMGEQTVWDKTRYWPASAILEAASAHAELTPVVVRSGSSGPAKIYSIAGGQGRLGLISPLSEHFCGSCNRLRITCDGKLRTCLFSDKEYRLRSILRSPKLGDDAVRRVIERAGRRKPIGYELIKKKRAGQELGCGVDPQAVHGRLMSAIGG